MLTETKRVENHDRVVELLNSVERDGISDLLKWLEESDFFTAPASRAYHGAYIGGLCEHSLKYDIEIAYLEGPCARVVSGCTNSEV